MARVLIIGFGNPLRGDDGMGWHAVRELERTGEGIETIACLQLTPELAEAVARSERVIFIDAAAGQPPGEVSVCQLHPVQSASRACSHRLEPQELLEYSRELYGNWPEAFAVSVNAAACDYSETLSARVQSSLPAVVRIARDLALGEYCYPASAFAAGG
jgi:hydrogenase maturation protease